MQAKAQEEPAEGMERQEEEEGEEESETTAMMSGSAAQLAESEPASPREWDMKAQEDIAQEPANEESESLIHSPSGAPPSEDFGSFVEAPKELSAEEKARIKAEKDEARRKKKKEAKARRKQEEAEAETALKEAEALLRQARALRLQTTSTSNGHSPPASMDEVEKAARAAAKEEKRRQKQKSESPDSADRRGRQKVGQSEDEAKANIEEDMEWQDGLVMDARNQSKPCLKRCSIS